MVRILLCFVKYFIFDVFILKVFFFFKSASAELCKNNMIIRFLVYFKKTAFVQGKLQLLCKA